MADEKTYSQEELNAAAAAAAARAKAEASKHIEADIAVKIEEAKKEAILNYEANKAKSEKVKEAFIQAGGKPEAFNDFFTAKGSDIRIDNDNSLKADIERAKEEKAYMFGEVEKQPNTNDKEKETEYYPGTFIPIKK